MSEEMPDDPIVPEGRLLINMIKANKILIRHIDRMLKLAGTSIVELGILHRIRCMGYTRLTDLAQDDLISKPRVSNILNAMLERGLIDRVKDSRDERVFELAIMEPGEKLYTQSIKSLNQFSREFFTGIDLKTVNQVIEKLLYRIEEVSVNSPSQTSED
ncbi:MAG: MarR family winged helix-turn-helix transcriptional regulator [Thermoplasmataceae archaeon]|jgi:DNA-binding MarR family transcriptional regulator